MGAFDPRGWPSQVHVPPAEKAMNSEGSFTRKGACPVGGNSCLTVPETAPPTAKLTEVFQAIFARAEGAQPIRAGQLFGIRDLNDFLLKLFLFHLGFQVFPDDFLLEYPRFPFLYFFGIQT